MSISVVPANPAARRLARELGLNIAQIPGSAKGGRITALDVKDYAKMLNLARASGKSGSPAQREPLPDIAEFGPVVRKSLDNVALATSRNMSNAWSRIPHAWLQETVDVTETASWRVTQKEQVLERGGALSMTVIIAKALATTLEKFPLFNSSYDDGIDEIVYRQYFDVGIAVDTEQGLVVPVLRRVNEKSLLDLARDLTELSELARSRNIPADALRGGSITLSNLGSIGVSAMLPIINWPQVAVVGVTASRKTPTCQGTQIVPRELMNITLGFDHRVINGADAARFLLHLKHLLEDLRRMLL